MLVTHSTIEHVLSPLMHSSMAQLQAFRLRHTLTRPLIVQSADVLQLERQIDEAQTLEQLALPILQHASCMTPKQASYSLSSLPWLLKQQRRMILSPNDTVAGDPLILPASVMLKLSQRMAELVPHASTEALSRSAWGVAIASRRLTSFDRQIRDAKGKHVSAARALPTVYELHSRVQDLASRTQDRLLSLMSDRDESLTLSQLSCITYGLSAVSHYSQAPTHDKQKEVMDKVYDHLKQQKLKQMVAGLGWRGIARLVAAQAPFVESGGQHGSPSLGHLLADATSLMLTQHMANGGKEQAPNGMLLPRCAFQYWSMEKWHSRSHPKPPHTSKYQHSTLPRVVVSDFTPSTLTSVMNTLYMSLPHDMPELSILPGSLFDTATKHMLKTLPASLSTLPVKPQPAAPVTLTPAQREKLRKQREAEQKAASIAKQLKGSDPAADSMQLRMELTSRFNMMPFQKIVTMLKLLDYERPKNAVAVADRLLSALSLAKQWNSDPIAAMNASVTALQAACAMKMHATSAGVHRLVTKICEALHASANPRSGSHAPNLITALSLNGHKCSHLAASLVTLGPVAGVSARMMQQILNGVEKVFKDKHDQAWTPLCVGRLLAATSHAQHLAATPQDSEDLGESTRALLKQLEGWAELLSVSKVEDCPGALSCAAGIALHGRNANLDRVKILVQRSMTERNNPKFEKVLAALDARRCKALQEALTRIDSKHSLLPVLEAIGKRQAAIASGTA